MFVLARRASEASGVFACKSLFRANNAARRQANVNALVFALARRLGTFQ